MRKMWVVKSLVIAATAPTAVWSSVQIWVADIDI